MKISQEGLSLIKKFEGCELEAYKCAAGVWTIGYGSTKGVKEGDTITQEEADELLLHEMEEYEGYINELVEKDLKQNEFDAQIKRWNKAGGKVLQGLVRRREAEALLFEGKEWHEV